MKLKMIVAVVTIFSFSIFAQDIVVPKKVKDAFAKIYPKVSDVKWSKESKKEFEAEFKENGKSASVVLNDNGKLLETEIQIEIKDLPRSIEPFVITNYKEFKITDAAKIVDANGFIKYEAEISKDKDKKDLMFDKNGKIILKKMEKSESEEKEENDKD